MSYLDGCPPATPGGQHATPEANSSGHSMAGQAVALKEPVESFTEDVWADECHYWGAKMRTSPVRAGRKFQEACLKRAEAGVRYARQLHAEGMSLSNARNAMSGWHEQHVAPHNHRDDEIFTWANALDWVERIYEQSDGPILPPIKKELQPRKMRAGEWLWTLLDGRVMTWQEIESVNCELTSRGGIRQLHTTRSLLTARKALTRVTDPEDPILPWAVALGPLAREGIRRVKNPKLEDGTTLRGHYWMRTDQCQTSADLWRMLREAQSRTLDDLDQLWQGLHSA